MHYVYLLHSNWNPERADIGYTVNVRKRLKAPNAGESGKLSTGYSWNGTLAPANRQIAPLTARSSILP